MNNIYWCGDLHNETCCLCNRGLINDNVIYDCLISGNGWGIVCPDCVEAYQLQTGAGKGQKYKFQPNEPDVNKKWLKVQG